MAIVVKRQYKRNGMVPPQKVTIVIVATFTITILVLALLIRFEKTKAQRTFSNNTLKKLQGTCISSEGQVIWIRSNQFSVRLKNGRIYPRKIEFENARNALLTHAGVDSKFTIRISYEIAKDGSFWVQNDVIRQVDQDGKLKWLRFEKVVVK